MPDYNKRVLVVGVIAVIFIIAILAVGKFIEQLQPANVINR
jgi:hypothetical protein